MTSTKHKNIMKNFDQVQEAVLALNEQKGEIRDGNHSFNELYDFRKAYNAVLFNEWASQNKYNVEKSLRHDDGELCFGGGWFIVTATLPGGQISNHYKIEDWDLFQVPEVEKQSQAWDGHSPMDVLDRLVDLCK